MSPEPIDRDDTFLDPPGAAADSGDNPMRWVHRSLRGRYHWAALLGLILSVPCAIVGYLALKPVYSSTGLIQISPTLPTTLFMTKEQQAPPMFDSLVATQAMYLTSSRLINRVVDSDTMRGAGWPRGADGVALLESGLKVGARKGNQIITVSVEHSEPRLCQTAVNAVLDAYQEIYGEQVGLSPDEKRRALEARKRTLENDINSKRAAISEIASEYGTDDLEPLRAQRAEELAARERALSDTLFRINELQRRSEANPDADAAQPMLEQMVKQDKELEDLVIQRSNIIKAIELNLPRLGKNHRDIRSFEARRKVLDDQVERRYQELLAQMGAQTGPDGKTTGVSLQAMITKLKSDYALGQELKNRVAEEARAIGNKLMQIKNLKKLEADADTALSQTSRQLDELNTEMNNLRGGRVSIASKGELPVGPTKDRRIPLAAAGGVGGFALGVAIVGLVGFFKRGYRYLDELEDLSATAALLGTLPNLESGLAEEKQLAALALHHIRNMLHVLTPLDHGRGRFFAVTSASAGEGKTTLTQALGMSFAMAGQRTILVDADLIGRGLSTQFEMTRHNGLSEALEAKDYAANIHESSTPGLWMIPAGANRSFDPERLSQTALKKLIAYLRERFDTILIDTGPILGSLEADLVCSLADRVVLTISRGQSPKLVQASLSRLRNLGVRATGLVFNRASTTDMTQSISHVSIHSESIRALPDGAERPRRKLTPLAVALGGQRPADNDNGAATGTDEPQPW